MNDQETREWAEAHSVKLRAAEKTLMTLLVEAAAKGLGVTGPHFRFPRERIAGSGTPMKVTLEPSRLYIPIADKLGD